MAVREWRGALDRRVHSRIDLACGGAVARIDRTVVLADPALGGHLGGEPVLPGSRGHRGNGLCAVRRTARRGGDRRHGRLRRRGISGQQKRAGLNARKPPEFVRRLCAPAAQRFAFFALVFFFAAFLPYFLATVLDFPLDFPLDFFADDFLPAFLVLFAFFGVTFFAYLLAAFLTFLTAVLAAAVVALAAPLIASVAVCSIDLSSSIASPRGCRSRNDSRFADR